MFSLILFAISAAFAYLAYDARKLAVPAKDVPFNVTARSLGLDVDGVAASELEKRKQWNLRYGLGDPNGVFWVWATLSAACAAAAVWSLVA